MAKASLSGACDSRMPRKKYAGAPSGVLRRKVWVCLLLVVAPDSGLGAQQVDLPGRPSSAAGARAIAAAVAELDLREREDHLVKEILGGNVPAFLRTFTRIEMRVDIEGRLHVVLLDVLPDVLAVGSDRDFLRIPLSPHAAQVIADRTGTSLPTSKISDAIWSSAMLRMVPQPIPPSDAMTTVPVFVDHHWLIEAAWPEGVVHGVAVAGIKKDVVLTPRLADESGRVAIYGWHEQSGVPIQPVYAGHTDDWVDYSHGIRLVSRRVSVDGVEHDLVDLLEDPHLWVLVSDEGPMPSARYPTPRR